MDLQEYLSLLLSELLLIYGPIESFFYIYNPILARDYPVISAFLIHLGRSYASFSRGRFERHGLPVAN